MAENTGGVIDQKARTVEDRLKTVRVADLCR